MFRFTPILFFLTLLFNANAQFPMKMWEYYTGAPTFGSPAAADLDMDGKLEIVFSTYTNDGRVHCLNAEDGSFRWIYDIGGCGDVAALIYDVDNDDTLDVIVNGSCNPYVFCINGMTGKLKWTVYSGGGDSPPTVIDIDGDSIPEILFGNFAGELYILNGEDGSINKKWSIDPSGVIQTEPTLVDVDSNGDWEIILGNYFIDTGVVVWCFDYPSGDTLWRWYNFDTAGTLSIYHGGTVSDIDGDGREEYTFGTGTGKIISLNVEDGSLNWLRFVPRSNIMALSSADLDDDGEIEVVYSNNNPGDTTRIGIMDGKTGNLEWEYMTTFSAFRGCAITDINGNGQLDLVSAHFNGILRVVEAYNGLIWTHDLKPYFTTTFPYLVTDNGPIIADFDQNGTMDIFVAAGYGTYTPDSLNTGKAFMFEAGMGTGIPGCGEWLMLRHDTRRTGYLPQSEIDEKCDTTTAVSQISLNALEVYPNPSSGLFNVQLPEGGRMES